MHNDVAKRAARAIAEKVLPGCVVGVVKSSSERNILSFGHLTYDENASAVREDTVYDIASVTKSIPTASLALNILEKGKFELSDPVKKYIPELQNDHGATIEDLLTYTTHGVQMSKLKDKNPEEVSEYIFSHGFDGPPGESKYTNLPAFLLGIVLERYFGDPLVDIAEGHFFMPLGMADTTFFPISRFTKSRYREMGGIVSFSPDRNRCAPTEIDDTGEVQGVVHDESARTFARAGKAVGHAGLFSTAPDILNFLEALLRGKYPNVVEGAQKGLGWQTNQSWFMGTCATTLTFGKTGFTGTSVLCDVDKGIALVILSNRTYPKRPPDAASIHSAINTFRSDIADILLR